MKLYGNEEGRYLVVLAGFAIFAIALSTGSCIPTSKLYLYPQGKETLIVKVVGQTHLKAKLTEDLYVSEVDVNNKSENKLMQIGGDSAKYLILNELSNDD